MKLYLVEFLVRLGVAVIADGTIKPRWYGSDQAKVCKRHQAVMWAADWGLIDWSSYYAVRRQVTGSNWQSKQYLKGTVTAPRALA